MPLCVLMIPTARLVTISPLAIVVARAEIANSDVAVAIPAPRQTREPNRKARESPNRLDRWALHSAPPSPAGFFFNFFRYRQMSQIAPHTSSAPHAAVTDTRRIPTRAVPRQPMMALPAAGFSTAPAARRQGPTMLVTHVRGNLVSASRTTVARTASTGDVIGGIFRTAKNWRSVLPSIGADQA